MLRIHKLVEAVCPIHGIRGDTVGDIEIDFKEEATEQQRQAALNVINSLTQDSLDVPNSVTRYQFKKAVLNSGQLAAVKAQYSSLSEDAKLYWDDATFIEIDSVLITELKNLMGLSDAQVENFFRNANGL